MNTQILPLACNILGLVDGCLLPASASPTDQNRCHWTDKGDWLSLAKQLGADSVFFVENEPVLVLAELPEGEDEAHFFNQVWCMARPQVLFLAREGELAVYQLTTPPIKSGESITSEDRLLALAQSAADIQKNLSAFRRESIESGEIYGDDRFGNGAFRADRALVHDLKEVRRQLTEGPNSLSNTVAHALIGRALFIRYLEDREIVVKDYFDYVAQDNPSWKCLLAKQSNKPFADPRFSNVLFFKVLQDLDFAYLFFEQLSKDFNGDTFPVTPDERDEVKQSHLDLLRSLLIGEAVDGQEELFLFAYRFDVIPIELISSIYEEFYTAQQGRGRTQSSYYTPPALVDFLLSRLLTDDVLDNKPRVTDPACGSGIFLVETFRRLVRHRVKKNGYIRQIELRKILRDQIRGIDLNPEAAPVAAFSLYLAYLHYQQPREINESRRLPNLRWEHDRVGNDVNQHFNILFSGNAFEAIIHPDAEVHSRFGPNSTEVVVGNPPWGIVKKDDTVAYASMAKTFEWCNNADERTVGDKEMSQAFVHLALELLVDNGSAALLLSSGVLFKQHKKSRSFRRSWLSRCKLHHVVNFAHVRHLYFSDPIRKRNRKKSVRESDGSSPFISVIFTKGEPQASHRFSYWSARRIATVEKTRAIIITHSDMHRLRQIDCLHNEYLWKLYWWGGRRDEGLVQELKRFRGLSDINVKSTSESVGSGVGYVKGTNGRKASGWLLEFKELKASNLTRYGVLDERLFVSPPAEVRRKGKREVYEGFRLLMTRGRGGEQGRIDVRLASTPFCFSHSIIGFRLHGFEDWQAKCVVGYYWSSLARYYLWLTSGSWGMWHDETLVESVAQFPIALPEDQTSCSDLVRVVTELQEINPLLTDRIKRLELELDELVFDLYELNDADRDLVRDMSQFGLDFFYNRSNSAALDPVEIPEVRGGLASNLPASRIGGILGYLQVFLYHWNSEIAAEGQLAWSIVEGGNNASILAVLFSTIPHGSIHSTFNVSTTNWQSLLSRFGEHSLVPAEAHRSIYTDTFVRAVGEHEILIIKRNEARHWTRSTARGDADATIARAINLADVMKS